MVFSTPHDEFCISEHDIWGEGTSDRYLQGSKMYLVISHTCGQVDQSGPIERSKFTFSSHFDVKNSIKSS